MTPDKLFESRKEEASKVRQQAMDQLRAGLSRRGEVGRDQVKDHELFSPISAAVWNAYRAGEVNLAVELSRDADLLARDYELATNGQVHKGAITFDLALLYLTMNDFTAAMRYFEIAEEETKATQRQADPHGRESAFDVFKFGLFGDNFWASIDRQAKAYPVAIYKSLWNVDFDMTAAKGDWEKLSSASQRLYLIVIAQRMRYRRLADETTWGHAESLHLAHWNLSADLGRIASAVHLLGATRNQVAHHVDDSMILFTNAAAATFTVDVLLSLCRVEAWTN